MAGQELALEALNQPVEAVTFGIHIDRDDRSDK